MPEESCETQAFDFLQTKQFSVNRKLSCFQEITNKCQEFVRISGERYDLMVQLQRKQRASAFPGLGFRDSCILPEPSHCIKVL